MLYYTEKVQKLLASFKPTPFFNFTSVMNTTGSQPRIVNSVEGFISYLPELSRAEKLNENQTRSIQPVFLKALRDNLKREKCSIDVTKCAVKNVMKLQSQEVYGVVIHRSFNLPTSYYKIKHLPDMRLLYESKEVPTRAQMKIYLHRHKDFHHNCSSLYNDMDMDDFIKRKKITRSLYQVEMQLEINLNYLDKTVTFGKGKRSTHLVQLERIQLSNEINSLFLTDFDFLAKGNPYTLP